MDEQEQVNSILGEPESLEAEIEAYEQAHPETVEIPEEEPEEAGQDEEVDEAPVQAETTISEVKQEAKETVPLAVFLDLKNELKELKRGLAEREKPKEEPKAEGPPKFEPSVSYNDDPAEFLRQRTEYLEQYIAWQSGGIDQARQLAEQQRKMQEAEQGFRSFASTVSSAEEQFRQQAQDYDDAVEFVRNSRYSEARAVYEANGVEINQEHDRAIRQAITQEFATLAANALQNGRNPASVLYTLAKARGFSGSQPAPTANMDSKVARLEKGVERSKSSQAAAGTRPGFEPVGGDDFFKQLQRDAGYRK